MLLLSSLVLVFVGSLQVAQGKECDLSKIKVLPGMMFPDLFKITGGSYMFSVEANLPDRKTEYITETVDTMTKKSLVEVKKDGKSVSFLTSEEENEIFVIEDKGCETLNFSTASSRKDLHWIVNLGLPEEDYFGLGPSAIIRAAYKNFKLHPEKFGINRDYVPVRQIRSVEWTWCADESTIVKLYFTDGRAEKLYGLEDIPVPTKITVSKDKKNEKGDIPAEEGTYSFFRMVPKVRPEVLEKVLQVPPKIGCQRLSSVETAPSFTSNIYLEVEMKYTPSPNYTYVTNLKYAHHKKSSLSAVQVRPWTTIVDPKNHFQPGDNFIVISSLDFVYVMDTTEDDCNITRLDDPEARKPFKLPDGQIVDLSEVFDLGGDSKYYKFIGKTTERGIQATVYEKTLVGENPSQKKIITRYYADEGVILNNEFKEANALLKMVLYVTGETGGFNGQIVFNIFDFKTRITHVHELFDVSPCFKKLEDSKWFQIAFPLGPNKAEDVIPQLYMLRRDLVGLLQTYDKDRSPLRILKMQMDVDPDYIYATGLVLERPRFLLDFEKSVIVGKDFSKDSQLQTIGIMNLDECAKTCLERSSCESFSYCGASCKVLVGRFNKTGKLEDHASCSIYTNDKYGKSVWTMNQLSSAFASQVETRSLIVSLPQKGNPENLIDLVADNFKNDLAFGLDGFNQKGQDFSYMFSVFKPESRLKNGIATIENELSFESCKSLCISRTFCESVSYCLAHSVCTVSDRHGENLLADDIEEDDQCMILSRNYMSRFREYSGLMVVVKAQKAIQSQTPEDCAKNCVKESEFKCQSFDFCDGVEAQCLLHTHHFNSLEENQVLKQNATCRHFSRNYVHDFDPTLGKDAGTNIVGLWVEDISAEECARLCKQNSNQLPCSGFSHCSQSAKTTCKLLKSVTPALLQPNNNCNSFIWKAGIQ